MRALVCIVALSLQLQVAATPASAQETSAAARRATDGAEKAPESAARTLKIPAGTKLEVEVAHTVNSQHFKAGDLISFTVMNPVVVDGVTVIEKGATATARIVESKRGGHFGKAGRLSWAMKEVTAVDGSRVPLRASGRLVGDSKGAKVATKVVLTGIVLWPIAPVALLHGFKRGANAELPAGKLFEVEVRGESVVKAPAQP